jgi:hypothetical protein
MFDLYEFFFEAMLRCHGVGEFLSTDGTECALNRLLSA